MTTRHNTKFRQALAHMKPAATDDVRDVISRCEGHTDLEVPGCVTRVVSNTGINNSEFMSLRLSDIDSDGGWLHINRPQGMYVGGRILPLRPKTISALLALHRMNPQSELVLGDHPRTRFDQMIRKLRVVAPQFARARLWTRSIRMNFACRLMSAGIPSGLVKYCLGQRTKGDPFGISLLTREQKLQVLRRNVERFLEEL